MTPEELLKPRYKVIADYPFSPYKVGDLMTKSRHGGFLLTAMRRDVEDDFYISENFVFEGTVSKYPHLFRKLEWWEERSKKQMPEYLKDIGDGEIFKVREWLDNSMAVIWLNKNKKMNHTGFHQANAEHFTPATEFEYNEYIKSKE